MQKNDQSRFKMIQAVNKYFTNYAPISPMPTAMLNFIQMLLNITISLKAAMQLQTQGIAGITDDKNTLKETLVNMADVVAGIIFSWASEPLNQTIRDQVDYSISSLKALKETELGTVANIILLQATNNQNDLAAFGLTNDLLQTFTSCVNGFVDVNPKLRNTTASRIASTKQITLLLKQADGVIKNHLDKMMAIVKLTDINAYNNYLSTRNILKTSTTVTQLKGKVTSIDNEKGLKNVLVTLLGGTEEKSTSASGVFSFKGLAIGNYTITLTAPGYKPLTITDLNVKQGKMNTQKIIMEKMSA